MKISGSYHGRDEIDRDRYEVFLVASEGKNHAYILKSGGGRIWPIII